MRLENSAVPPPPSELPALLEAARAGDQKAFATLLAQYSPLIEGQLARLRSTDPALTREDEQDLRQEAYLAFYRALMSYDTAQTQVSFGLYAKICMDNALLTARRHSFRAEPLDDAALADVPGSDDDPTRRLREEEDFRTLYRVVEATLSPYENSIWQRFVAGQTAAEIADALGQDTRSVHNALYRIRHKLRSRLTRPE